MSIAVAPGVPGVSTNDSDCTELAPAGCSVCSPPEAIRLVQEYLAHSGDAPSDAPADKIISLAESVLKCNNEACVMTHPNIVKYSATKNQSAVINSTKLYFKPVGPRNTIEWLSDANIEKVLSTWQVKFKFYHCPYAMMDFEKQESKFATVSMSAVRNVSDQFVCVLNTDVSTGPGEHWVATFVDMRPGQTWSVEYFDSVGNPPPAAMARWMERRKAELKTIAPTGTSVVATAVTTIRHQRSNTECGLYSLYYIRCRLEGRPVAWFMDKPIPDTRMRDFRKHVFRNQ